MVGVEDQRRAGQVPDREDRNRVGPAPWNPQVIARHDPVEAACAFRVVLKRPIDHREAKRGGCQKNGREQHRWAHEETEAEN